MKFLKIAVVTLALSSAVVGPASAAALSSEDGTLTIDWVNPTRPNAPCTTQDPVGIYTVSSGVRGYLYNATCNPDPALNPDVARLVFYDLEGSERCFGRMTLTYGATSASGGRSASTEWNIDGVIPGLSCQSAGSTVRVPVYAEPAATPPSDADSPAN